MPTCAPVLAMAAVLLTSFQESPALIGSAADKTTTVLFVAPGGTTWTLVRVDSQDQACILTHGTGLQPIRPPASRPPSPQPGSDRPAAYRPEAE